MIITRTPFRITLGGGGTDLPGFYRKHGGYILAMGIDKYMYVALNVPHADRKVRLHYTQSETVDRVEALHHELAREALLAHDIHDSIEIASLADLPAGTGLGSSSCYLVGLLNAIRAYRRKPATFEEVAEEACRIELEKLGKPIGKQDQYMAAAGGLTELHIARDGRVRVERVSLPEYAVDQFTANTHMYYTNVQRTTVGILGEQSESIRAGTGAVEENLIKIREIGYRIGEAMRAGDFDMFGRLTHEHWLAKRALSASVSVSVAERLYEHVRETYGVLGGKIAGAGGGGFLMLYCPQQSGAKLTKFMEEQGLARLPYRAEYEGSRVITNVMSSRAVPLHVGSEASP
jgi:D-glycero-alpha-D-manno-heptose-7-phosphate kinase